jgi:hypothetical protein
MFGLIDYLRTVWNGSESVTNVKKYATVHKTPGVYSLQSDDQFRVVDMLV